MIQVHSIEYLLYVVRALRELGIYFDEDGCLHSLKDNSRISMKNLSTDPVNTITTITHYVFGFLIRNMI